MARVTYYSEADLVFAEKPKSPHFEDLTGRKFNRLTVLGYAGKSQNNFCMYYCKCQCGNITKVLSNRLKSGKTGSCGCWQAESRHYHTKTHGHAGIESRTATYRIWVGMLNRCQNPNNQAFEKYGGRGIAVCEHWQKYENFLADMKECPGRRYSLDRINNDGNYQPDNCRWATWKEQGRNKRNNRLMTYNGKTLPMSQWAEELGINRKTILTRVSRGWSDIDALTVPIGRIHAYSRRA